MPDPPELPPRPAPQRRLADVVSAWLRWIGYGRLVGSAVSVVIVVGGAMWLLRSPQPATEAALPMTSGSAPTATLPVPTTDAAVTVTVGSTSAAPAAVIVHVAGAVSSPGVYTLSSALRVADAVAAAGGGTVDSDLDALNLAAPIADGQRIYVPRLGEVDPAAVPSGVGAAAAGASSPSGGPTVPPGPVDLNTATAADLELLPGVGPSTAAAIVDDRTRNGPFATVADLDRVTGIGPAKLEALRDLVTV